MTKLRRKVRTRKEFNTAWRRSKVLAQQQHERPGYQCVLGNESNTSTKCVYFLSYTESRFKLRENITEVGREL